MALCHPIQYLRLHFLFVAQKFLIVGGNGHGNDLATEVIDIKSNSNDASTFGEITSRRKQAAGGLLGTSPIICGGKGGDDSCLTWKKSQWTQTHTMKTKRFGHAG